MPDDARPPPQEEPAAELPGKKKYIPPYTPKSALDRARAAAEETRRAKEAQAARAAKQASSLQIIPKPRTSGQGGASSNGRQQQRTAQQVGSLSSSEAGRQLLMNDWNQVSSVSLLMTSSTALANKGLFELTRRPSLTRAVSLSFAQTTEEPGCSQMKRRKLCLNFEKN